MLDTIRKERRLILDVLFLVTAGSILSDFLAGWLATRPPSWRGITAILAIAIVVWRIAQSELFSAHLTVEIPFTVAFDNRGRVLARGHLFALHGHVIYAVQELVSKHDVKFERNLGGDAYGHILEDACEAAMVTYLEDVYNSDWKPVVRRQGNRMTWGFLDADKTVFRHDQYPESLSQNRALAYPSPVGEKRFCAPPKTLLTHTKQPRKLGLKNKYVEIDIELRWRSCIVGLPRPLAENRGLGGIRFANEMVDAGGTSNFLIVCNVKLSRRYALSKRSEETYAWAETLVDRLRKAAEIDWEDVARHEREVAAWRARSEPTSRA